MHFWRTKAAISKRAQFTLLFCALLAFSVLLVSIGTIASSNAAGSNPDEASGGQAARKAPPGMVWIPGGTFLMGTDEVSSFPNERPAHRVQVAAFWIDDHDVTNAEFAKFVEAIGYVTTAERKPDWEELKKELPPDTPKPDDSMLVAGSLVFTPTAGPVPLDELSAWWRWVPGACRRHSEGPGSPSYREKLSAKRTPRNAPRYQFVPYRFPVRDLGRQG